MKTNKEIEKNIISDLKDALSSINAEDSVKRVVEINEKKGTVLVEFTYNEVPEDDYVGLATY